MDARQIAGQFATDAKAALGDRLQSIVLYGSAVRAEWLADRSDINVLVLVDDISGGTLAALAPVVRRYVRDRVRPILVEQREWARAADVFGIELADMQDWHALLAGEDPLMGQLVPRAPLRLQAERELRGKLLQLNLGLLLAESPAQLGSLLMAALPALATYFRAALRLAGQPVAGSTERTLREGCALVGADPAGLLAVMGSRQTRKPLELKLQDPVVDQCIAAAERLTAYIDNFGREQP